MRRYQTCQISITMEERSLSNTCSRTCLCTLSSFYRVPCLVTRHSLLTVLSASLFLSNRTINKPTVAGWLFESITMQTCEALCWHSRSCRWMVFGKSQAEVSSTLWYSLVLTKSLGYHFFWTINYAHRNLNTSFEIENMKARSLFTSLIALLFSKPSLSQSTLSICAQTEILKLRNCAQWCIANGNAVDQSYYCDRLALFLDCGSPVKSIRNDCFCRQDLLPTARSYLTSCVNSACGTNSVDVLQAVSVYYDYCAGVGKLWSCVDLFYRCRTLTILVAASAAATSSTDLPSPISAVIVSVPKTSTIALTTMPTTQIPSIITVTATDTKVLVGSTDGVLPAFTSTQGGGKWAWRSFTLVILVATVAGITQLGFNFRLWGQCKIHEADVGRTGYFNGRSRCDSELDSRNEVFVRTNRSLYLLDQKKSFLKLS